VQKSLVKVEDMSAELTESVRIEPSELPSEAVIFGSTAAMRDIRASVEDALHNSSPVLIEGESGSGKELVGMYLHAHSTLCDGPFVKLNCAAMSNRLLEGNLFGYENGAFPGVKAGKKGAIELAESGTLFLDEISEMDWESQTRLLGVLRDGHFSRIGGSGDLVTRVRVICATNRDLELAVARRTFRLDLLSGLNRVRVRLLPLRERREDIPQLCEYLLEKMARNFKKPAPKLSDTALRLLQQWKWPGNMRELENWIARIIIFGTEEVLGLEFSEQLRAMSTVGQRHHRIAHLRSGVARRARRPHGG
jgi:transcriptional regulator with PAS, ATPase and Fis domain